MKVIPSVVFGVPVVQIEEGEKPELAEVVFFARKSGAAEEDAKGELFAVYFDKWPTSGWHWYSREDLERTLER